MKAYGIISDSGDGSSCIYWFKNEKIAQYLLDSDNDYEQFYANEGDFSAVINFPDGVDPTTCGISFDDGNYLEVLDKLIDE